MKINVNDLEKSVGLNRNTLYMKASRDKRVSMSNGEVTRKDAIMLLNYYLSNNRYRSCHDNINKELTKLSSVNDDVTDNNKSTEGVNRTNKDVTPNNNHGNKVTDDVNADNNERYTSYEELPHSNIVINFLEGSIWKGLLAAIAVGVSSFHLFAFIDEATLQNGINIPVYAKWAEAIVVSFIGVTMAVTNRQKKVVLRSGFTSTSGRFDRKEVSVSIANIWLFVFFALELLAMLSLWGIIQSDAATLTILALLVPVSTLSFAHLFLKK